jgi:hypothetical protein
LGLSRAQRTILVRDAGSRKNSAHVGERLSRFGLHAAGNQLHGGRIEAQLTADVQRTINLYGLTVPPQLMGTRAHTQHLYGPMAFGADADEMILRATWLIVTFVMCLFVLSGVVYFGL